MAGRNPKLATEVRREQIVQAALGILATEGLRGLSIVAVARRVGLVPSGLYRHFKNKDEILEAVLDLLDERLLGIVRAARETSSDPLEQLWGVLLRHVEFIREGRAIPRLVFSDDFHHGHPERRERIEQIMGGYLAAISAIIETGQRGGVIRGDSPSETLAMVFFGLVMPAGIRWHLSQGQFDVTRHARRAWPVFLAAIAPPSTISELTVT